jgi:hypothetical protein
MIPLCPSRSAGHQAESIWTNGKRMRRDTRQHPLPPEHRDVLM